MRKRESVQFAILIYLSRSVQISKQLAMAWAEWLKSTFARASEDNNDAAKKMHGEAEPPYDASRGAASLS